MKPDIRDKDDFLHTAANLSEKNKERLKKTPKNGGNRSNWKDDPKLQINAYTGKDDIFKDVYGRITGTDRHPQSQLSSIVCQMADSVILKKIEPYH